MLQYLVWRSCTYTRSKITHVQCNNREGGREGGREGKLEEKEEGRGVTGGGGWKGGE